MGSGRRVAEWNKWKLIDTWELFVAGFVVLRGAPLRRTMVFLIATQSVQSASVVTLARGCRLTAALQVFLAV